MTDKIEITYLSWDTTFGDQRTDTLLQDAC